MMPEFTATACAGIFAGAAVYINLVQHPAASELGTAIALQFFRPMYARAAPMQGALAAVGSLAALWAWWSGSGWLWLLGAALLGFVIPFTLVAIIPTNNIHGASGGALPPSVGLLAAKSCFLSASFGRDVSFARAPSSGTLRHPKRFEIMP